MTQHDGGAWLQRYLLHVLMVGLLGMTAAAWNTMAARVEQIDASGTRASLERLATTDARLVILERQIVEQGAWRLRMEDKIDALLKEIRVVTQ